MFAEGTISIRAERLARKYRSGTEELVIFSELDLDVAAGERLAIVGESGSGKSTLLYLLGALDRPTGGTVRYGGQDIYAYDDARLAEFRNQTIGFVWQMNSLLPEFTAVENVMMPLLVRGTAPSDAEKQAQARLEEVGLKPRSHHRPGELSGGEQQRVALARALAGNPKVLLADEPTGNLDYKTGEGIQALIREVHHHHRLTSITVTHNLSFAQSCDRVLQLEKGLLYEKGLGPDRQERAPGSH
jgi:lipoprotein-releasing system ATP-binding protein